MATQYALYKNQADRHVGTQTDTEQLCKRRRSKKKFQLGRAHQFEFQSVRMKTKIKVIFPRFRGRLHGAFWMPSFMYDKPFVAETCNIAVRRESQPITLDATLYPSLMCDIASYSDVIIQTSLSGLKVTNPKCIDIHCVRTSFMCDTFCPYFNGVFMSRRRMNAGGHKNAQR
jgi:hypothetical protein